MVVDGIVESNSEVFFHSRLWRSHTVSSVFQATNRPSCSCAVSRFSSSFSSSLYLLLLIEAPLRIIHCQSILAGH